jgi:hypothetical protein
MSKTGPKQILSELAWHVGPPLAYGALMLQFFPYWQDIWISFDEGYNLMKAMMVVKGYAMYSQIWSDQPPLLTYLLAELYRINGYGVYASRILILAFSCVIVWSIAQFLRLAWGNSPALLVLPILLLVPNFPLLSAAVMVGQPSLALASVSLLFLAAWHRKRQQIFLVLSALAFSLSILAKLFTAPLALVFFTGLVVSEYFGKDKDQSRIRMLYPALLWSSIFTVFTLAAVILSTGTQNIAELIQPHLAASQASVYPPNEQLYSINYYLLDAWPILALALIGVVAVFQHRRWLMLYPLAWMGISYVELSVIKPVWFHHQLLVTLPAAMLAAVATSETLHGVLHSINPPFKFKKTWPLLASGLLCVVLVGVFRAPDVYNFFRQPANADTTQRHPFEDKLLKKINQFAPQTNWMVTDMPMFAFRADLKVPPDLVVISWKRLAAGDLDEQEILNILQTLRPEQVLFGRFEFAALDNYLTENYDLVLERNNEKTRLYIRKSLRKPPS